MKKTLTFLMVAAGVVGFAGVAAAECAGHMQSVQSTSKPTVTADAGQSTPVTTTTETAEN